VITSFLPGWFAALLLLAASPFSALFMMAHHRFWEKRDQTLRDQQSQLWKTEKLIGRFKK